MEKGAEEKGMIQIHRADKDIFKGLLRPHYTMKRLKGQTEEKFNFNG